MDGWEMIWNGWDGMDRMGMDSRTAGSICTLWKWGNRKGMYITLLFIRVTLEFLIV